MGALPWRRVKAQFFKLPSRLLSFQGSMTAAQASVGKAAAWPTTGTILITALPTRHGAARTPHPESVAVHRRMKIEFFIMAKETKEWVNAPKFWPESVEEQFCAVRTGLDAGSSTCAR